MQECLKVEKPKSPKSARKPEKSKSRKPRKVRKVQEHPKSRKTEKPEKCKNTRKVENTISPNSARKVESQKLFDFLTFRISLRFSAYGNQRLLAYLGSRSVVITMKGLHCHAFVGGATGAWTGRCVCFTLPLWVAVGFFKLRVCYTLLTWQLRISPCWTSQWRSPGAHRCRCGWLQPIIRQLYMVSHSSQARPLFRANSHRDGARPSHHPRNCRRPSGTLVQNRAAAPPHTHANEGGDAEDNAKL